jgi:hypothetical protein
MYIHMAYSFYCIYYNFFKKIMAGGSIAGLLLLGLLVYGIATGFDDGNGYDEFN